MRTNATEVEQLSGPISTTGLYGRKQQGARIKTLLKLAAVFVIALTIHPSAHTNAERIKVSTPKRAATSQTVQPAKVETAAAVEPQAPVTPPPVTPTYPVGCANYEPIVAQYNWDVRTAMAIMQAESGCNPYAVSPASLNYDDCSDFGLMQIHCNEILDPNANIAAAYQKYQAQGWRAWSTYNSGEIWRYY